jgi:transcription antitermination factor NusG
MLELFENRSAGCSSGPGEALREVSAGGSWYAIGVSARHEKSVARILVQKGYETFLPLFVNRHQYGRRAREFELPIFPGYVFSRFPAASRMPILTTPGVLQIVGAGRDPVAVDEAEMAAVRLAARVKARMQPCAYWSNGQKGRVESGPLRGLEGVVTRVKPTHLVLSISLLKRSVLVEIEPDDVALA